MPAARVYAGDPERVRTAASLQQRCPSWLVIWSPWRRAFTGFACFTAEPVIVDEAVPEVFVERVRQVEQAGGGPLAVHAVTAGKITAADLERMWRS